MEFDSGESFTKVKAKLLLDDTFTLYKETIEIGNSIKFTLNQDSIDSIAELILYIENILQFQKDKYKIPVFAKVTDSDLIDVLDARLKEAVLNNINNINISEIDIIGATEIFNHNDTSFTASFGHYSKEISELSLDQLKQFSNKNRFNLNENILEIKIISYNNGTRVRTDKIKNLIDYTDDTERCVLLNGQWYHFNDDYLSYLADSIKEIDVIYKPEYNFHKALHNQFLQEKYTEEKDRSEYDGKTENQIKVKIKNKYYAERYYGLVIIS